MIELNLAVCLTSLVPQQQHFWLYGIFSSNLNMVVISLP